MSRASPVEVPMNVVDFATKYNILASQRIAIDPSKMASNDDEIRYLAFKTYGVTPSCKTDTYWKIRFMYYQDACDFNSVDALSDPDPRIVNAAKRYAISHINFSLPVYHPPQMM